MTLPVGALMSWHLACCQGDMSNTPKLRNSQMQPPADAGEVDIKANSQRAKPVLVRQGADAAGNKQTDDRAFAAQ